MPDVPRPSRFRRYSLRTLLALTALAAVVCGYVGSVRRQYLLEQEIARSIEREGDSVEFWNATPLWLRVVVGRRQWFERIEYVFWGWKTPETRDTDSLRFRSADVDRILGADQVEAAIIRNYRVDLEDIAALVRVRTLNQLQFYDTNFREGDFQKLGTLPNLETLVLVRVPVSDRSADEISRMTQLTGLALCDAGITDETISTVAKLGKLTYLDLRDNQITDKGVRRLTGLKQLERLDLSGTKITDASLEVLHQLPNLKSLLICNTQATDAGLTYLADVKNLSFFVVEKTAITRDGAVALQTKLPDASIFSDAFELP